MSILEAFLAGKEARRTADAAEQINAMQQFIGQNGAAIMGGDPNALGQLAGFGQQGLQMAMGVQGAVQDRQRQEKMDAMAMEDRAYGRAQDEKAGARADQEWEMQLAEYAAGKTAAEREAEAAKIEEGVKAALTAKTPQEWDALAQKFGAPDLVGQFDNREAIAAKFMTIAEVLKAQAPPEPAKPLTEVAQLKADLDAGRIDQATYESEMARRAPKGSEISFDPATGAMTIREGVGVGSGASAPTSAVTTEAQKGKMAYESLSKGLDDYEAIFKLTGGSVMPGADKDALVAARRGIQLQMKELFNLGVLNGPDLSIMDALLVDATSIQNNALDAVGVADLDARVAANLTQLRKMFKDLVEPKVKALGEEVPGSGSPPSATGFDQAEIDQLMNGP